MNNTIQIYQQFDQLQNAADALYKSGFFADIKSQAQAIVKVMAGAELGLPPFASMTGINIIQGKPTLGANVIATLVKNDPRYDYQVITCNDQECTLAWFENGKERGKSTFTIQEAQQARLVDKDNWKKYPSDMLFARAISRGSRRFAPGIFGGSPVYTPDEMNVDVDPDGYIDAHVTEEPKHTQEVAPKPVESKPITKAMVDRWNELANKAYELGLIDNTDDMPDTYDALVASGKDLHDMIVAFEAQIVEVEDA